jgi:hypothetical protein
MAKRFNTPPGWPAAPEGWLPPAGWQPDPSWPSPPEGWELFVEDSDNTADNLPARWIPGEVAMRVEGRLEHDERQAMSSTSAPAPTPGPVPPPPAAPPAVEPGVVWSATGQPITGIGAGRYKLTATMLFFEKGAFSTRAQQVPIAHVIDVDMRQSITQRARSVGNVLVHVQRSNGVELVVLEDIPDPRGAVSVINSTAHAARLVEQQRTNTHHYSGVPPTATPAPAPAPAAAPAATAATDPIEQLRRLGELRDAGILTEEEFATKKAEILSRL